MNKRIAVVLLVVSCLSFAGVAMLFQSMPAYVPSHWNIRGNVDGFAPKSSALLMSALPLALTVALILFPKIDPRRNSYQKHSKAYGIIAGSALALILVMNWLMVISAFGYTPPVTWILRVLLGISFIAMGNFMPQLRSNFFAGFRTPWALDSELVWRKTQRAGGFVFVIFGFLFIFGMFFGAAGFIVPMIFIMVAVGAVTLYSFVLHHREKTSQQHKDSGD